MKCIFQLVSKEHGFRSAPISCTRNDLANELREAGLTLEDCPDDLVLVIAEERNDNMTLSRAPLFTVKSWLEKFPPTVVQEQIANG